MIYCGLSQVLASKSLCRGQSCSLCPGRGKAPSARGRATATCPRGALVSVLLLASCPPETTALSLWKKSFLSPKMQWQTNCLTSHSRVSLLPPGTRDIICISLHLQKCSLKFVDHRPYDHPAFLNLRAHLEENKDCS